MEVDDTADAAAMDASDALSAVERLQQRLFGLHEDEETMEGTDDPEKEAVAALLEERRKREEESRLQMEAAQLALQGVVGDPQRTMVTFSGPMTTDLEPIRGAARRMALQNALGVCVYITWYTVDLELPYGKTTDDMFADSNKFSKTARRVDIDGALTRDGLLGEISDYARHNYFWRRVVVCENYDWLTVKAQEALVDECAKSGTILIFLVESRYPVVRGSVAADFWRVA